QEGKIEGGAVGAAGRQHEHVERGDRSVAAENVADQVEQCALAIAPAPVAEEEDVFVGEAGQAITEHAADGVDQLLIVRENPVEEAQEQRARCARRCRGDIGDLATHVLRPIFARDPQHHLRIRTNWRGVLMIAGSRSNSSERRAALRSAFAKVSNPDRARAPPSRWRSRVWRKRDWITARSAIAKCWTAFVSSAAQLAPLHCSQEVQASTWSSLPS